MGHVLEMIVCDGLARSEKPFLSIENGSGEAGRDELAQNKVEQVYWPFGGEGHL